MMPLVNFIVALLIGALTGLGVGSGGLFLIYLTLVLGVPQITAQGMNLAFFIFAALASSIINLKNKRIDIKILVYIAFFGIFGVLIGSLILPMISPDAIRKIFGLLLIIMALVTFFVREKTDKR